MRHYEDCIMGCPKDEKFTTHCFPADPERRAEWCRILGVNPKARRVCICSSHFKDCYIFGTKLSKYAVPNPPDPGQAQLNNKRLRILRREQAKQRAALKKKRQKDHKDIQNNITVKIEIPDLEITNGCKSIERLKADQRVIPNNKTITMEIPYLQATKNEKERPLPSNGLQTTVEITNLQVIKKGTESPLLKKSLQIAANDVQMQQCDTSSSTTNILTPPSVFEKNTFLEKNDKILPANTFKSVNNLEGQTCSSFHDNNDEETDTADEDDFDIKTGDFEIRRRDTKELIVQLRSIKTENSRVLSFILPQKFALQQIIKRRDIECNRQYKQIKKLKTANARLLRQLKILRWATFQCRFVKPINRYLSFNLKKYRQRVARLKKKLKRKKANKRTMERPLCRY